MTELLTAVNEEAALEDLHARGCTDGLPVVIPTPQRVERMLLATGQDGDMVLGTMGPGQGIATLDKVAWIGRVEKRRLWRRISAASSTSS